MKNFLPPLYVARRLFVWLLAVVVYVACIGALGFLVVLPKWTAGDEAVAVLSFALGILVAFRTNTANNRWWEARQHWGQLVNDIRNLALKIRAHAAVNENELLKFDQYLIAFPHALRLHLRGDSAISSVPGFENDTSQFSHPPGYIAGKIHEMLGYWNREGRLVESIWVLDTHARSLLDICGACERIRNTPLASSYRSLVRWSVFLYVLVAPWAISVDTGWTLFPVFVLTVSFLFGMELTAEAIEEPFGTEGDDLPLEALCQTIERFVNELSLQPIIDGAPYTQKSVAN